MSRLYGLGMSNYYSLTKALMIYKGMDFEEVKAPPTQKEDNLVRTPMGKMPSIGVDGVFMSESLAIATYLERQHPTPALLPADPLAAGKVMELVCHIKLDVELVARRCLSEAFFGQSVTEETKISTEKDLARGMQAVDRLLLCKPFAAGSELTLADFYTFYCFGLANGISQKMFGKDLMTGRPALSKLMGELAQQPSIAAVEAAKT